MGLEGLGIEVVYIAKEGELGLDGLLSDAVLIQESSPLTITSISPPCGYHYTLVEIRGGDFGSSPGVVTFTGQGAEIVSWSKDEIVCISPGGISKGWVVVAITTTDEKYGEALWEQLVQWIKSVTPEKALPGDLVRIQTEEEIKGEVEIFLDSLSINPVLIRDKEIYFHMPNIEPGKYEVVVRKMGWD